MRVPGCSVVVLSKVAQRPAGGDCIKLPTPSCSHSSASISLRNCGLPLQAAAKKSLRCWGGSFTAALKIVFSFMMLTRSLESAFYEYSAKDRLRRREDFGQKFRELSKRRPVVAE